MYLYSHPKRLCRRENAPRFVRCKRSRLDEDITELGELTIIDASQIIDDLVNESATPLAKFRRQSMGAKIRRHNFQFIHRPHRFEYPDLGIKRQAIPTLGFNRCRTELQKPLSELHAKGGSFSHRLHSR